MKYEESLVREFRDQTFYMWREGSLMAALRRSFGSELVLILQQIEKMEPRPNCDCLIDVKVLHTVLRRLTVYVIDSNREQLEKDIHKFELRLSNPPLCCEMGAPEASSDRRQLAVHSRTVVQSHS